jgi:hypothetical protein
MKKTFIIRCLATLGISVLTLFNAATTNAQTDVLDLFVNTGDPIFGCETTPDVEINVNLITTDPVTTVIIQNISGYRLFNDGTCDKKYKFCAPNNHYCSAIAPGKFLISFRQTSGSISVNNLSFEISTISTGGNLTVKAFRGGNGYTVLPVGNKYTCETAVTPIDYVEITTNSVAIMDTEAELFVMDKLFIPSVTGSPLPDPPTITPSGPLTFCTGGSVTLTSSPGISYLWSTGATTSSISVSTTGSYTVTVIPAPHCTGSTSETTDITVNTKPTVIITNPVAVCSPVTVNLTAAAVTAGSTPGLTFTYWTNASATTSYSTPAAAAAGTYYIKGTTAAGCFDIKPVVVTVNPLPTVVITNPIAVCSPATVNLTAASVTAGSTAGLTFTYFTNASATTPYSTASAATAGTYYIKGTTAAGCYDVKPVVVTVNLLPGVAGSISGAATVSQGQSAVPYSVPTISNASGYQWSYSGTGATISGTTNSVTIDFSASATSGNLTVKGSNSCGYGPVSADFHVTVTGGGPGVLIPEIVCLLDLSWSMNRDFFDHTTSDPNAVKLKHARNSLLAFIDLLYSNNPDNAALGLVRFPNSPQVNCDAGILDDLQTLDNQYHLDLASEIPILIADGNSTPLLAGIDTAINMLKAPVKKIIVLLTDGRQNCPYTNLPVLIDNTKAALTGALIKLYTIGFGAPGIVPNDMLNDIATTSGGLHYNIADEPEKVSATAYDPSAPGAWDPATALDAAFSHIIVEGLGLSYLSDPLAIISSGTKVQYDIPVSALDERICFFVSWVTSQENFLGVKLFTPAGVELSPGQSGILTINRSNHTIITLTNELLNQPGMTGLWKLEIDGSGITNNSEHYQYSVINTSRKLDLKTWFEKGRYFTGDKMKIFLEVLLDGKPLTSFDKLSLQGTRPEISLGNWLNSKRVDKNLLEKVKQKQLEEYLNWLSSQPQFEKMNKESKERSLISQKENFLKSIDPVELRVRAMIDDYKLQLPGRITIKGLSFTDDGKKGDEKAGDGIYTAIFVPKQEGSYIFNTSCASTIKEQKVLRESHLQTYVGTKILLKPVFRKIRLIEKALKGETIYDIIFLLKDKYGNIPMPDAINNLKLSTDKGILMGGITDNMDGTFTQRISLPENINPKNVIMTLTFDGMSGSTRIAGNNLLRYLLAGLVLAIITGVSFLRMRKKN